MNISQRVKNAQPTQCRIDHYQIPVTETHKLLLKISTLISSTFASTQFQALMYTEI